MNNLPKHKKQWIFPLIVILMILNSSCSLKVNKYLKRQSRLSENEKNCQTITYLKTEFKQSFNHPKYNGKTVIRKIDNKKIKVIQDTIQITLEDDTLSFHKLLEENLINTKIFIEDLDFLDGVINYEKTKLPNIKHTFSIFGLTEIKCSELEKDIKRYRFYACLGDIPTNGIIYYLEVKKSTDNNELVFLQSFGIMI
jgi:phage-related protein